MGRAGGGGGGGGWMVLPFVTLRLGELAMNFVLVSCEVVERKAKKKKSADTVRDVSIRSKYLKKS